MPKGPKQEKITQVEAAPAIAYSIEGLVETISLEREIKTNYSDMRLGGGHAPLQEMDRLDPSRELDARFTYHAPRGDQQTRFIVIRAIAKELGRAITRWCPPSRERELALTALDTVVMWANAAIARREA